MFLQGVASAQRDPQEAHCLGSAQITKFMPSSSSVRCKAFEGLPIPACVKSAQHLEQQSVLYPPRQAENDTVDARAFPQVPLGARQNPGETLGGVAAYER
jgi:hypothetical protein